MPPLVEPPHEKKNGPHDRENRPAFNTLANALKALETSRMCLKTLMPGKVWRHRGPHGETEMKASLTLDNVAVVVLHFSLEDGSLLPKGLHGISEGKPGVVSLIETRLKEIPQKLIVLEGAEFREPESCWAVPLAHEGRIVGHLKVSSDGTTILPDKRAAEDLDRAEHGERT